MDEPFPSTMMEEWSRFLEKDGTIGGLFDSPVLFPLQRKNEMIEMHKVATERSPKTIMEIGADKGGSVFAWCKCIPTLQRMIVCEIRGTPYKEALDRYFTHIDFLYLEESSYEPETAERVRTWLGQEKIDILFIDGDKSHFMDDYEVYRPLIAKNAIVFMHDVNHDPMKEVFCKVRRINRYDIIEDHREWRNLKEPVTAYEHWLAHWKDKSCTVGVIYE
jgi:predicted O-methyltransferase YrrM